MKKRLTDVDIWRKPWFTDLNPTMKCLVRLIYDQCDMVGVFEPNWRLWSVMIGDDVGVNMLAAIDGGSQFRYVGNNKWLIPDFVKFQYGDIGNTKNPIAKNYIQAIVNHGLMDEPEFVYLRGGAVAEPSRGRGGAVAQEKEKEKEKETEGGSGETKFVNGELVNVEMIEPVEAKRHLLESELWRERTMMNLGSRGYKLSRKRFDQYILEFIGHCTQQFDSRRSTIRQFEKWFERWVWMQLTDRKTLKKLDSGNEPLPAYLRKSK